MTYVFHVATSSTALEAPAFVVWTSAMQRGDDIQDRSRAGAGCSPAVVVRQKRDYVVPAHAVPKRTATP
jgi:hypothetical protein